MLSVCIHLRPDGIKPRKHIWIGLEYFEAYEQIHFDAVIRDFTADRPDFQYYCMGYPYENFYPNDGQGWSEIQIGLDNTWCNFLFTRELHASFIYRGFDIFIFRGNGHFWASIDEELMIDLGAIALDDLIFTIGSVHKLSFFLRRSELWIRY